MRDDDTKHGATAALMPLPISIYPDGHLDATIQVLPAPAHRTHGSGWRTVHRTAWEGQGVPPWTWDTTRAYLQDGYTVLVSRRSNDA